MKRISGRRKMIFAPAVWCAACLLWTACSSGPRTRVKNVIFFIGDGMSVENQVATSRYLYGTDTGLAWHSFPNRAYLATWDVTSYNSRARKARRPDYRPGSFDPRLGYDVRKEGPAPRRISVPGPSMSLGLPATDSASAATALSTGRKTDNGNLAWLPGDPRDGGLRTIMEDYRDARGAAIGVISTVPFDHATPAGFVAHNTSRTNYYTGYRGYPGLGIGDEIIEKTRPDVVIAGGHPAFNNPNLDKRKGYISKGLLEELRSSKEYVFIERTVGTDGGRALEQAAVTAAGEGRKLFGLFGGETGGFEPALPEDSPGRPSFKRSGPEDPTLADAVTAALMVLSRDRHGFFLMAEQGDIDWANHNDDFAGMIGTMAGLEQAVRAAIEFVDRPGDDIDWTNTVIIVTADHATGGLRLVPGKALGPGRLPRQVKADAAADDEEASAKPAGAKQTGPAGPIRTFHSPYLYPGGEVEYYTVGHTNDLVTFSLFGPAFGFFEDFKGLWYPGPIIDNTQVNKALREALGL